MPVSALSAVGVALTCLSLLSVSHGGDASTVTVKRNLIVEAGTAAFSHVTTYCNPRYAGSEEQCTEDGPPTQGNVDYPWGSPEISYPTDGSPWGVHITGPYPDGHSYLISWFTGDSVVGTVAKTRRPDTSKVKAVVGVKKGSDKQAKLFTGQVITYQRVLQKSTNLTNYNYLSPYIHHVVVSGLKPATPYSYQVSDRKGRLRGKYAFTTLPSRDSATVYPLRIGLIGDVGQTANSTATRDHLLKNSPQVILHMGDNAYATSYSASEIDDRNVLRIGTNQRRWDSYAVLWEKAYSAVPTVNCIGNHEIENSGIAANINYTTTSFSFPTNYPFQSYASRFPSPGTTSGFGNINKALYYSTIIGGKVKLITMNNYVPFHEGTPQYKWAMREFASVDRTKTPWLFVMMHAGLYHTYVEHYKEMECFKSIWEDTFYEYGVDMVLSGHVHAYERTHGVYRYQWDTCGPMYLTVGDGGNVGGMDRAFIDQVHQVVDGKNLTYCETGDDPNQLLATNTTTDFIRSYQAAAQLPSCPIITFQPPANVDHGPVLVPYAKNKTLGFCQSSQPLWSAHRDPSFGHAMLEITSDTTARFRWFRNQDQRAVAVDDVVLQRTEGCPNKANPRHRSPPAAKPTKPRKLAAH